MTKDWPNMSYTSVREHRSVVGVAAPVDIIVFVVHALLEKWSRSVEEFRK